MLSRDQYKLEGTAEVMNALKELPIKLQAKFLKEFIRKTGKKFIVDPLKLKLSYSPETESSLKVVNAKDDKLAVQAGVTGKGYVLRWADLGTKERKTKKGWNRGSISPKNQIQPLIESQIEPIVTYINEELGNEINKILEKKLKKLKKAI